MLTWIFCIWVNSFALSAETLQIAATKDSTRIVIFAETGKGVKPIRMSQKRGEQILRLVLLSDSGKEGPPILGQYNSDGKTLTFAPRYALTHGQRYRAIFTHNRRRIEREYLVPARASTRPAIVVHIYPSAHRLPANLLKFYIHFSKPMREGKEIFDQIEILDAAGRPVPSPWRRMELWSADARRLTLWIHPGRIKRGLKLREELGPVLKTGRKYSLSISADVMDANGQRLGKSYVKEFEVIEADRQSPSPSTWRLSTPKADSRAPLRIRFGEPLDRHLSQRLIKVSTSDGTQIGGLVLVSHNESSWSFVPDAEWSGAEYVISIDPILEDLAGNTPLRLFDVDIEQEKPKPPKLKLKWVCGEL